MKKYVLPALLVLTALIFTGCPSTILPTPKITESSGGSVSQGNVWGAPQNVTASHGLKGRIELSWKQVRGAAHYHIYEADNAYSTFSFKGETDSDATSFTVSCNAGTDKWYKVIAAQADGTKSPSSDIVRGTSLANPYINRIDEGTISSSQSTVNWYMNNLDDESYQSNVRYVIYCKDSSGTTISETLDGSKTSLTQVTFKRLTPNTKYKYTVAAFNANYPSEIETSAEVDAETAHKTTPNAVENLTVTQGTNITKIKLSFTLPEMVDILQKDGTYTKTALRFEVYKRAKGDTSAWSGHKVDDIKPSSYNKGDIVTWDDNTSADRGIQYEYRVQSFADVTGKIISSDESVADITGWLVAEPSFEIAKIKNNYDSDTSPTKNLSTEVTFNFSFETFRLDSQYAYKLTTTQYDEKGNTISTGDEKFDSIAAVNSFVKKIDAVTTDYYYMFSLGVWTKDYSAQYGTDISPENIVLCSQKISTIDKNKIDFEITSGYKDELVFSIGYDGKFDKTIEYNIYTGSTLVVSNEDILNHAKISGLATYEYKGLQPGHKANYFLLCTGTSKVQSKVLTGSTIGTAAPVASSPAYKTVTVTWAPVENADEYTITLVHDNKTSVTTAATKKATELTQVGGKYEYTIEDVSGGYDIGTESGNPITVSITSTSRKSDGTLKGSTTASIKTCTLGPALMDVKTNTIPTQKEITVYWNEAEGAKGYAVYRLLKDTRQTAATKYYEDLLYVDASNCAVSDKKTFQSTKNRTLVTYDTNTKKYTLKDNQYPADESSGYQVNQSKIQWGLPIGYVVLPVKDETDFGSLQIQYNGSIITMTDAKGKAPYFTDVNENAKTMSTCGLGLNVTATKSEYGSKVALSWEKPYINKGKIPYAFKRECGTTTWENGKPIPADSRTYDFVIEEENLGKAFDFAIQYGSSNPKDLPNSYIDDLAKNTDANNESINKGYCLALDNFNAKYNGSSSSDRKTYYGEFVGWNEWDYSKRAVGPASFTIDILNLDKASTSGWTTVANVSISGSTQTIKPVAGLDDTEVEVAGSGINIYPTGIANGTATKTTGLLQVLRSSRHYYSVNITGTNTERQAEDMNVYACRQITDEELVKSAMLVLGQATEDSEMEKYSSSDGKTIYGIKGSFTWTQPSKLLSSAKEELRWTMKDYVQIWTDFPAKTENHASFISVTDENTAGNIKGRKDSTQITFLCESPDYSLLSGYYYDKTKFITLTVSQYTDLIDSKHSWEKNLTTYNATIRFACSDSNFNVELYHDKTKAADFTKTVDGEDEVKKWCPVSFNGSGFLGRDKASGWWN